METKGTKVHALIRRRTGRLRRSLRPGQRAVTVTLCEYADPSPRRYSTIEQWFAAVRVP